MLLIYVLFSDLSKILTSARSARCSNNTFFGKSCLPLPAAYIPETGKHSCLHSHRREKMPLMESTCCMNCHRLLQRIVVLETKLLAGLPKQTEHTADSHHGPPQHTAGESCESSESQQFIPSVEEQAETDRRTNRWHKQGARPKGSRDIRLSRVSRIAAAASSTPDMAMARFVNTGILQPPIHLENRFEALMNVGEESPNVTKHGSNQPAANIATNRGSRSSRQRHSAQSAAEPRTLIVGDSIIRNISSRTTTTCCFPQATVSDVNKEHRNILMKHKTANQIIIQRRFSRKQSGKLEQHTTATGNTRARAHLRWRHNIPLSSISTSKLLTENRGTGVCWDQTLLLLCCKPPDIN